MRFPIILLLTIWSLSACGVQPAGLTGTQVEPLGPLSDSETTCSVKQNKDGSATITCPDGSSATVVGGKGDQGDTGDAGPAGTQGLPGADGSSCSVVDNQVGTYTMTCTNGTNVTWSSNSTGVTNPMVPDGVLYGSYVVSNVLDMAFLNGVTHVTGDLSITGAGLTTVSLPNLQVGGGLWIGMAPDLEAVSLPGVTRLRGSLGVSSTGLTTLSLPLEVSNGVMIIGNPNLTTLTLETLTGVQGNFIVEDNGQLTSIAASPSSLGGNLSVRSNGLLVEFSLPITRANDISLRGNGAMESIAFPDLINARSIYIRDNTLLDALSLPVLAVAGSFVIEGNDSLVSFSLPALETLSGNLAINWSGALSSFAFPVLAAIGGELGINDNSTLESFSLPVLTAVLSDLMIQRNASLCNSYATALDAQVAQGGGTYINNNLGACP